MLINEIFCSVQGEGPLVGTPCVFIRTWGCVEPHCSFCDSKYSWLNKEKEAVKMSIDEILKTVNDYKQKLVVITGGEPFAQGDIYYLIRRLLKDGYDVQLETSGKAEISYDILHTNCIITGRKPMIVMSPKLYSGKFVLYDDETLKQADYYKFVIGKEREFELVQEFIESFSIDKNKVCLMPKGASKSQVTKNSKLVVKYCIEHGYKFSPRLHVNIWGMKRGV